MYIAVTVMGLVLFSILIYSLNDYASVRRRTMSFKESMDLTGLPIISFENNGHTFNFMLDTGAKESLIDQKCLENMKFEYLPYEVNVFGVDGIDHKARLCKAPLAYKGEQYEGTFLIYNMETASSSMKRDFGVTLHGIIGSGFFKKYRYILNFDELIAYSAKHNG